MKFKKLFSLIIIMLLSGFSVLSAQEIQPTPYQKKQLELSKKYFQILYGYKMSMLDEAFYEEISQGKDVKEFLFGLGFVVYAADHSKEEFQILVSKMEADFNQAKRLKNATDFRLEREAKAREEQAAFDKTEVGILYKNIKSDFEIWNKKGEFEIESDYELRLQNYSRTFFDSISLSQIKLAIDNVKSMYWHKELSTYNTEGQYFPVLLKINGVKWQSKLKIPLSKAEVFKNAWSDFEFVVDDKDWCFLNNSISPTIVNVHNKQINSQYKFTLPQTNQSEILVAFDKMGIKNNYLSGYIFNDKKINEEISKREIERQRIDAIDLAFYNNKLDSICRIYNIKLLNNPFNIGKKRLTGLYQVEKANKNREETFNHNLELIKSDYERITNRIESDLKSNHPSQYCEVYFSMNMDKKAEADKKYIECWCNYSERSDFDLAFIEGVLVFCNCRKDEYKNNEYLFNSEAEFNSFYDQGSAVIKNEIDSRILKKDEEVAVNKIISNSSKIKNLDFKDVRLFLSKDYLPSYYYKEINFYKYKPYYEKVLDVLIETNKDLKKEWKRNGTKFLNKVDFYHVYTSGEYEQFLKQN